MDPNMFQNAYNQDPKKAEEQRKKQLEAEEKRKIMLQSIMTNEARERLSRLALVKPEKARQIEDMIIQNGTMGVYKGKISESELIGFLEGLEDHQDTKISFKRKVDSDDDLDIDNI